MGNTNKKVFPFVAKCNWKTCKAVSVCIPTVAYSQNGEKSQSKMLRCSWSFLYSVDRSTCGLWARARAAHKKNCILVVSALLKSENLWVSPVASVHTVRNLMICVLLSLYYKNCSESAKIEQVFGKCHLTKMFHNCEIGQKMVKIKQCVPERLSWEPECRDSPKERSILHRLLMSNVSLEL